MSPLLPFSLKASPSQPTASIENSFGSSFTFASTSSSMLLSPTSAPLPPSTTATTATTTTTTTTTSLDKPSPLTTTASQSSSSSSCAFPSWPNRPSLVSTNTCASTTSASSAYISDEELLDTPLSSPAVESECPFDNSAVSMGTSMSFASEQRIRHVREVAEEEEHRAKFLAQVQAHARVQMAKRGLQPPPQQQPQPQQQQQQTPIAARRKRRAIVPVGKKRRAASGTSSRGYPRV